MNSCKYRYLLVAVAALSATIFLHAQPTNEPATAASQTKLFRAADQQTLQAELLRHSQRSGADVTRLKLELNQQITLRPVEQEYKGFRSIHALLVPEGVDLDLNGGTLLLEFTSPAYGVRLTNRSSIRNGTISVVSSTLDTWAQSIFNSAVSVGAAYGDGGTVSKPNYFSSISDWSIQDMTISQPFFASGIQIMGDAHRGVVRNIKMLNSDRASHAVGLDWGTIDAPDQGFTTADQKISDMARLFAEGKIYSTHPHDILIESIEVGRLTLNVDDDRSSAIRTSGCHNITIRNVTIAEAAVGIALHAGDVGYEFAKPEDRKMAHKGYVIENFRILKAHRRGLFISGITDNVWRAQLRHGYQPQIDPNQPGIDSVIVRKGFIRGAGIEAHSMGVFLGSSQGAVLEDLDVAGFGRGVIISRWNSNATLRDSQVSGNFQHGVVVDSGMELPFSRDISIVNNTIFGNGVQETAAGIYVQFAKDVRLEGNRIGRPSDESQFYGIFVGQEAKRVTESNNEILGIAPGGSPTRGL